MRSAPPPERRRRRGNGRSRRETARSLAIIAAVLAMAPLELQRHIINTFAGHEKVENLAWLCGGYLIAALAIGGLKYLVNIKSSGLGEYMIRSLRETVLRSSSGSTNPDATPDETRKDKSGALVTTISSQAEAVGNSSGTAFQPR